MRVSFGTMGKVLCAGLLTASASVSADKSNSDLVLEVFDDVRTGSVKGMDYYSDSEYVQHNLGMADGKPAVAAFFSGKPTGVTVDNHFLMEDGDITVSFSTYGGTWGKFVGTNSDQVGFDVFHFKDGLMVEHWDNLINVTDPVIDKISGNSQVNNLGIPSDPMNTDKNKALVSNMVSEVLMKGGWSKRGDYFSTGYIQHSPGVPNGTDWMASFDEGFKFYKSSEYVYGQGNYVLAMSEGYPDSKTGLSTAYYDLFRIENDLIIEHWDTQQIIPAEKDWANSNGKW